MSRIWKSPIVIPSWVTVELKDCVVTVKWPKWELKQDVRDFISLSIADWVATVSISNEEDVFQKWVWGLTRTLISNMVIWVTQWYEKQLEIIWVGYKFDVQGTEKLNLSVGFSHKVELQAPKWVTIAISAENKNILIIKWISKELVWFFTAKIRWIKKPEPYKGKGIRYVWEYVRRKAWKTWGKK